MCAFTHAVKIVARELHDCAGLGGHDGRGAAIVEHEPELAKVAARAEPRDLGVGHRDRHRAARHEEDAGAAVALAEERLSGGQIECLQSGRHGEAHGFLREAREPLWHDSGRPWCRASRATQRTTAKHQAGGREAAKGLADKP